MKGRLGDSKAITATAHKLARLVYFALRNGWDYVAKGIQGTNNNSATDNLINPGQSLATRIRRRTRDTLRIVPQAARHTRPRLHYGVPFVWARSPLNSFRSSRALNGVKLAWGFGSSAISRENSWTLASRLSM